jgi:hypothetical protein
MSHTGVNGVGWRRQARRNAAGGPSGMTQEAYSAATGAVKEGWGSMPLMDGLAREPDFKA